MRLIQLLSILALAFLLGCQPDSLTDAVDLKDIAIRSESAMSSPITKPFKATGYGHQVTPTIECALSLPRAAEGDGTGTHIGRYEVDIQECLDLSTGIATGVAVHTSANGDLMVVDYTMQYIPDPDNPYAVEGIFTSWSVNGSASTGRFAGATGNGTGSLTGDLEENWMEWHVVGTITY